MQFRFLCVVEENCTDHSDSDDRRHNLEHCFQSLPLIIEDTFSVFHIAGYTPKLPFSLSVLQIHMHICANTMWTPAPSVRLCRTYIIPVKSQYYPNISLLKMQAEVDTAILLFLSSLVDHLGLARLAGFFTATNPLS